MKAWEHVINAAMLGTDKPMPGNTDLPEDLAAIAGMINSSETLDKEEKYLHMAAAIYNYRQCGFAPLLKKDINPNKAAAETKVYCADIAAQLLNDILEEANDQLLMLWLTQCRAKGQLLLSDVVPAVLDKAQKDTSLQELVIECSGNRGVWLSHLNPDWNFFNILPDQEIWQGGSPVERANLLKKTRLTDPNKAREWLQQTWAQESAATKLDLLKTLQINLGEADLPWLESLLSEKGQKVKDEVLNLLKQIPGSAIVKQYEDLLRQSVILKKEKALLGMVSKVSIQQKIPDAVDESIYKSGIEKLTGQKSGSDESYIIYQLMTSVPPSFWEKQFEATPEQVVSYFEKYAVSQMGALVKAVVKFKADNWIPYFLNQPSIYADFINKLPVQQRDKYMFRFFANDAPNTINVALNCYEEWSVDFTISMLSYMASNNYTYNRAFFSRHINVFPVSILSQLERINAGEANQQAGWEKQREHLTKLLHLKQQTLKAFNA
jgi:Family of unknown function (DUF5691)